MYRLDIRQYDFAGYWIDVLPSRWLCLMNLGIFFSPYIHSRNGHYKENLLEFNGMNIKDLPLKHWKQM